jgi:RES domain-containing protein
VIEVFRIHGASYEVFDTTGTALFDGRWHTRGVRMVYTAGHVSLAALEVLVHAGGRKLPPKVLTRIQLADGIEIGEAPWLDLARSQAFGDRWLAERRSAVLRVPSVAVNGLEFNYLLNPAHPEFRRIEYSEAGAFTFDARFFGGR